MTALNGTFTLFTLFTRPDIYTFPLFTLFTKATVLNGIFTLFTLFTQPTVHYLHYLHDLIFTHFHYLHYLQKAKNHRICSQSFQLWICCRIDTCWFGCGVSQAGKEEHPFQPHGNIHFNLKLSFFFFFF